MNLSAIQLVVVWQTGGSRVQPFECGYQKDEKNCVPQPFVAMPVDNRMELWMFVVSNVLYAEGC